MRVTFGEPTVFLLDNSVAENGDAMVAFLKEVMNFKTALFDSFLNFIKYSKVVTVSYLAMG